jgi:hypothetical protein
MSAEASVLQQPADVARAVVLCAASRSPLPEIILHPHYIPVRGFRRFAQFQNMKAMPDKPGALREGVRRHNGRLGAIVTGASKGIGLGERERVVCWCD